MMFGLGNRGGHRLSGARRLRRWAREHDDHGAALIEFAVLAPLLLLLVLGIIEFGWLFGQFNDVRHGAREGARFAAVNAGDNTAINQHVCLAMDGLSAGISTLEISLTDGSAGNRGDIASIAVTATVGSLTNAPIITIFLPSDLTSEVEFRLEQDSDLWGSQAALAVTC